MLNLLEKKFASTVDGTPAVPRTPLGDKVTAMGVWIFYTLFVIVAFAIEKIGQRGQTNAP
jgi:hypothetical protein